MCGSTQTAAVPQSAPTSAVSSSDSGHASTLTASAVPHVALSAALAHDTGDLSLGAKVLAAAHSLLSGDGSTDAGATAHLASLGWADGGSNGAVLGGADTDSGIHVALAADTPDIGSVPADFHSTGGDFLNVSSLDVPSLDLCSIGHSI